MREVVLPMVLRGEDDYRGVVIEALGRYHGTYAVPAMTGVAKLDGPLQDDAVTAVAVAPENGALRNPSSLSAMLHTGFDRNSSEAYERDVVELRRAAGEGVDRLEHARDCRAREAEKKDALPRFQFLARDLVCRV